MACREMSYALWRGKSLKHEKHPNECALIQRGGTIIRPLILEISKKTRNKYKQLEI